MNKEINKQIFKDHKYNNNNKKTNNYKKNLIFNKNHIQNNSSNKNMIWIYKNKIIQIKNIIMKNK